MLEHFVFLYKPELGGWVGVHQNKFGSAYHSQTAAMWCWITQNQMDTSTPDCFSGMEYIN